MQDIEDYQLKEMGYAHERIAQVDQQMAEKRGFRLTRCSSPWPSQCPDR